MRRARAAVLKLSPAVSFVSSRPSSSPPDWPPRAPVSGRPVALVHPKVRRGRLDGLDLEVERYQAEDESLQVLDQVVENAEAFWVCRLGHIDERTDLGRL